MAGGITDRQTTGIHDDLYVDALVLCTDDAPVALASVDIIALHNETVESIRCLVSDWTGIPGDRVLIAATHTHNAPQPGPLFTDVGKVDQAYMEQLVYKVATATTLAYQGMVPARMAVGVGSERGISFNRRLRLPDGGVVMNIWGRNEELRQRTDVQEGPFDPELGVVRVEREDGTPLACLFSYGLHNTSVGGTLVSRDWSGFTGDYLRRALQAEIPVIHFQGAQGNVNYLNYRDPNQLRGYAIAYQIAEILAGEILQVWSRLRPEAEAALDARAIVTAIADRPVTEADRAWAQEVLQGPSDSVWERQFAREVMYIAGRPPQQVDVQTMGIRLNESAIVTNPAEVFAEFGLQIKARAEFRHILMATLTNGYCGYVCTPESYRLPRLEMGYEPRRTAFSSRLAEDAGERMVAASLQVLGSL